MYTVEHKPYGYKITFGGFMKLEEMMQWVEVSKKELADAPKEFGVFIDMRELKPLEPPVQEYMKNGQKLFKDKGMKRSVVILTSPITKMQFQRIAKETGIYAWERYLDIISVPNWEEVGEKWITSGVDPDQK